MHSNPVCNELCCAIACSISDETAPEELRGKYSAFALQDSAGISHLRRLQAAGLTHVHLLPSYDYGSVPERLEDQATIQASWWYCLKGTTCLFACKDQIALVVLGFP